MKARVLGLIGGGVILGLALPGSAADSPATIGGTSSAAVLQVIDSKTVDTMGRLDGDNERRTPGTEQSQALHVEKDGKHYLVTVYMAGIDKDKDLEGRGPYSVECASYEMQLDGPPKKVVDRVRLVADRARRGGNHPRCSPDEKGNMLCTYGSDYMRDRPSLYAMYVSNTCQVLAPAVKVSFEDSDSNDGAGDKAIYVGKGPAGESRFVATYLSTNGGPGGRPGIDDIIDDDNVWAMGVKVVENGPGLFEIKREWDGVADGEMQAYDTDGDPATPETTMYPKKTSPVPVITQADIGRPSSVKIDANRAMVCAARGDNRPADMGVYCTTFDFHSSKNLWTGAVEMSDPNNRIYFGQATIYKLQDGLFAVNALKSNGYGKDRNMKGQNESHLHVMGLAGDALVSQTKIVGAPVHQTHSALCTGLQGETGHESPTIGVISAAPTGIGRSAMRFLSYDASAKSLSYDATKSTWPTSWYADSAYAANMYGENPMRQGRDFLRCEGDMPNPGYGQPNGYMKDVKSFFITSVSGRVPGSMKNSLFVSLVPGVLDKAPEAPTNPQMAGTITPAAAPPEDPGPAPKPKDDSGCACSTPGHKTSNSDLAGGLVLLGLAIGGMAARRRRA